MKTITQRLCLAASFVTLAGTALAQPAFHLVGNPPGLLSNVVALSRDGSVAIGTNGNGSPPSSFRWTLGGGREDFLTGSSAGGVSPDGSIIVGAFHQPYRRLADGTVENLGTLPGFTSGGASGVSADGSVVTGTFARISGGHEFRDPFRWTPTGGMQPLPGLSGGLTDAYDISDDGKTIVGTYKPDTSGSPTRAFVWREGSGVTFLTGPTGADGGMAHACSADGSVVGGVAPMLGGGRWVNGVFQPIGTVGDFEFARPLSMSDDGNVIVGQLFNSPTHISWSTFVWTKTTGIMESIDYFKLMGVPLPTDGNYDYTVFTVSGDGKSFGGVMGRFGTVGLPAQGFVAHVPAPGIGLLSLVSFVVVARRRR